MADVVEEVHFKKGAISVRSMISWGPDVINYTAADY